MIFFSFEASPTSGAVMCNTGKLLCSYPGPAIAVPVSIAKSPTFCEEFAIFAQQMDRVVLPDAIPKSTKAGSKVPEERDTVNPKFITQMLTGILRAIGRPVDFDRFQKRVADDVLWNNAKLPWRRSPLWLVVRVGLQIALKNSVEYKAFMIFFLSDILEEAVECRLDSALLFVMNAKLSRRGYKLRDHIPRFVLSRAYEATAINNRQMRSIWAQIQEDNSRYLEWEPTQISFRESAHLSLRNCGEYLTAVMNRKAVDTKRLKFKPNHTPRNRTTGASGNLPSRNVKDASEDDRYIFLADFESWVKENLDKWVEGNIHRDDACEELARWINDYTGTAKTAYKSNPEDLSIMLLTTYELWIAMDKVAVNNCPLLLEYTPELALVESYRLFDPLLLPRYQQMERLSRVEEYLQKRRAEAKPWNPSIFSDDLDGFSFAVCYFRQSSFHQKLDRRILDDAEKERRGKIEEFDRRSREYDELQSRAKSQHCTIAKSPDHRGLYQHLSCDRCKNERRAKKMRINLHEWPLPKNDLERMAVVFELQCPLGFSVWRDTTFKILVDICTPDQPERKISGKPFEQLWEYSGLKRYFVSQCQQRLAWSSKTKSFQRSHYRDLPFPTSVETICVDNALNYARFDKDSSEWANKRLGKVDVRKLCTFSLPEGPYKTLQYAVDDTSHTSNEVISRQHACSVVLSLHEYYSFGTLRAGHRLQWLNIARELRTGTLKFNDEAVDLLLMQTGWQAGPPDPPKIYRESHVDLGRPEFGQTLLGELDRMLTSIEANWMEATSAKTLISLAARLLSTSKHQGITDGVFSFLRKARQVTLNWTRRLATKVQECKTETDMDLQRRTLQMAAICRGTYDVYNQDHLEGLLCSTEDVAVLIECAIIVYNNAPSKKTGTLPRSIRQILDRDRRFAHTIESFLWDPKRQAMLHSGLYRSMERVCPNYISGSTPWRRLPSPNDRWIETKTGHDHPLKLHYNLLSGALLIDGSPVGRMPLSFVSHPTYRRLFGEVNTPRNTLGTIGLISILYSRRYFMFLDRAC